MCLTCARLSHKRDRLDELYVDRLDELSLATGLSSADRDQLQSLASKAGADLEYAWQELEHHMAVHMGRAIVPAEVLTRTLIPSLTR